MVGFLRKARLMAMIRTTCYLLLISLLACAGASQEINAEPPTTPEQAVIPTCKSQIASTYPWLEAYDLSQSICNRIPPPAGYERKEATDGSESRVVSISSPKARKARCVAL